MSAQATVWSRVRVKFFGLIFLAFIVALIAASIGSYLQIFSNDSTITVQASRSGLLLDKGADVTLRGVVVGRVTSVEAKGQAAVLKLALSPSKMKRIPANVTADITAPTVFGAKFVDLTIPAGANTAPSVHHLEPGAVLTSTKVSIEANTVFANLVTLLDAVQPAKIYSILGTISTGLNDRGQSLGNTVVSTNTLATNLDRNLPALQVDLQRGSNVLGTYAQVSPALLQILANVSTTAGTLVATQGQFTQTLQTVETTAHSANALLARNTQGIEELMTTLRPTTATLSYYAPVLPCLVIGTNTLRKGLLPILGGEYPGLYVEAGFLPGSSGYDPVKDAPILDTVDGPDCLGGVLQPTGSAAKTTAGKTVDPYPHIVFHDGTSAFANTTDGPTLNLTSTVASLLSSSTASPLSSLLGVLGGLGSPLATK